MVNRKEKMNKNSLLKEMHTWILNNVFWLLFIVTGNVSLHLQLLIFLKKNS